jgi:hypothetical protein
MLCGFDSPMQQVVLCADGAHKENVCKEIDLIYELDKLTVLEAAHLFPSTISE